MRPATSFIAKTLLAVLISGGMLAASAQAQYMNGATAPIPFTFSVRSENLGSGTYEILTLPDPSLLAIRKAGTGRDSIFMVRQQDGPSIPAQGYLVFRRDAGQLYLSEIHFPGTHTYSVLLQRHKADTGNTKIALFSLPTNATSR